MHAARALLTPPHADTRRVVMFLLLGFFCVGVPRLFTNASAFALFLEHFDASLLPYTYLLAGAMLPFIGMAYLRLARRFELTHLLLASLAANVLILVALRIGLASSESAWLIFAATVWVEVEWTLGNLVFWVLAERVFDLRQAKRQFGIIAAGDPAAAVVGGALLPPLLLLMDVPDLLWISAGSIVLAMGLTCWISRRFRHRIQSVEAPREEDRASARVREPGLRRYLGVVFGLAFAVHISFFILDNAFYTLVDERFEDRAEVARFIGVFFALMGIITLSINFFVTAAVLRNFGVRIALSLVPALVLLGSLGVLTADTVPLLAAGVFWLGCLSKLIFDAGWQGLGWPSFLLLYQPLPPHARTRAQAKLESFYEPVATAVAAAMLLAATSAFDAGATGLFAMAALVLAGWLLLTWPVSRLYHGVLASSIQEHGLGDMQQAIAHGDSLGIIRAGVGSKRAEERLYCARLLLARSPPPEVSLMTRLLSDQEPLVRTEILGLLEASPRPDLQHALAARLGIERFPPTRAALLRAFAACAHPRTLELLSAEMDAPSTRVRLGAMVGLLRHGGVDGVLVAGERFLGLARSSLAAERRLAARVLAATGLRAFDGHLAELLQDRDEQVQLEALRAQGWEHSPALWPHLIAMLPRPGLRRQAMAALAAAGSGPAVVLRQQFEASADDPLRCCLLCLLAPIHGAQTLDLLETHRHSLSAATERVVVLKLAESGYRVEAGQEALVRTRIRRLGLRAFRTLEALWALDKEAQSSAGHRTETGLLTQALHGTLAQDQEHAVALAGLLLDAALVQRPWREFRRGGGERAAHVVELMDELLPRECARVITPLLDGNDPARQLALLAPFHPNTSLPADRWLTRLAGEDGEARGAWVQSCALHAMGSRMAAMQPELLAQALDSPHAIVRETALWALHRTGGACLGSVLDHMLHDDSPMVARFAHSLVASIPGGDTETATLCC